MVIDPMLYEKVSGRKGDLTWGRPSRAWTNPQGRPSAGTRPPPERPRLPRDGRLQGAFLRLAIMKPVLAFVVLAVIGMIPS
ncbi:MAG: hypothetical protein R3B49_10510 [Phycisphaerales bacterium]